MESFSDFKRVAIVVCPKPEELEKRTKDKKDKKGFEVPDFALNDMKGTLLELPKFLSAPPVFDFCFLLPRMDEVANALEQFLHL